MYVRAILMALPLAIGTACSTTQSRSNPGAHTATASSGQTEGNVTTSEPKTAAEPNASPTSPSDQTASSSAASDQTASSSAGQTEGNVTTSEPKTATESDTSPSTSSSASASSSSPSASGSDVTRDPIMEPGDEVQAHAGDDVVSGTIARVSRRTLVIDSDAGEQKTLFLAPETSIQVDGQDARRSDLQEGQDVRASFNEVNGRDIAVKVRVGEQASSTTELGGSSATPESGSSGSSWERGPGGTGTPSEPGNTSSDTPSDTSSSSGTR